METVNLSKENIFLSLVNHNYCKDKLVGKPSRTFLDMDVAYSFSRPDSSIGTAWLKDEDMKALGLSEEELYDTDILFGKYILFQRVRGHFIQKYTEENSLTFL